MRLMTLDIEMNQRETPKIIQIGIVVGESADGTILHKERLYVNPHEPITEMITKLTGITQEQVDIAPDLLVQFRRMRDLYKQFTCYGGVVKWGGSDIFEIRQELHAQYAVDEIGEWPFGRRWIDTKTLFIVFCIKANKKVVGGLAKSLTRVGMQFQGRKHDGLDDAVNTWRMLMFLLPNLDSSVILK